MLTQTVLMLAQFIFTSINLCSPFNNTTHSNNLQAVLILTIREDNYFILFFLHKPCTVNKAAVTPCSSVLLVKLTGRQLVKNFPTFYGTQRFITAFTCFHHLFLTWASSIQSIPSHPTSWRFIVILSCHLDVGLSSGFLPSGFPTKTLYTPYALHAPPISFFSILSPKPHSISSTDH